ncbi:UPF0179 family protein [[Eubacterium] cellulosolvens]
MGDKKIITIIGPKQARIGFRFLYQGTSDTCNVCKYQNACLDNLEEGRIYSIKKVKNKKLPCELHGSQGRVVEVVEDPIEAAIEKHIAIQDALINFNSLECDALECENIIKCNPLGLFNGDKCKVIKIMDVIDCPKGFEISSVLLQRWSLEA